MPRWGAALPGDVRRHRWRLSAGQEDTIPMPVKMVGLAHPTVEYYLAARAVLNSR